jgi:hypothetical protein
MDKPKMLHISVSSLDDFLTCRRLYYYKRIKKYEKMMYSIPFLVGKVVHTGIANLMEKKKDAIKLMIDYFKKEKKIINDTFTLSTEKLQEVNEQEYVTKGMVEAYAKKYGKMLSDAKHLKSEVEGALQIADNVTFVIKLDNLLSIRGKKILHELKTSKYITPEYIKMIQTDRQTTIYFRFYNIIFEKYPIQEIMYDVIRKPSIRQKKTESYPAYLKRLSEWYDKPEDMSKFHVERFKEPIVSEDAIVNTVTKVADEMLRCKTKEDYYENHDSCASYYGDICPYYELCHKGGETKENLVLYQIRKSYHVDKSNKQEGHA